LDIGSEQFNEMILIIKDLAKGWKIVGDGWGGYLFILSEPQKTNHLVNLLIN
jgi:galactokinase/mevalonate kinase-like predicted kinase